MNVINVHGEKVKIKEKRKDYSGDQIPKNELVRAPTRGKMRVTLRFLLGKTEGKGPPGKS